MKSYTYLFFISTMLTAGSALADAPSCISESGLTASGNCTVMGYTYTTSKCSGKAMVKCPFDSSKVWCHMATPKTCEVGDIVFSDNYCYSDLDNLPNGLTPRAVVFDTTNKLAIELKTNTSGYKYMTPEAQLVNVDTGRDLGHCKNGLTGNTVLGCKVANVAGVRDVMAYSGDTEDGYAQITAGSCTGSGCQVYASVGKYMSWVSCTDTCSCTTSNPCKCTSADGCEINENFSNFSSLTTTESGHQGFNESLALLAMTAYTTISGGTIGVPAANYCYSKNDCYIKGNCDCTSGSAIVTPDVTVHPWFLPRVGDLITLGRNMEAVQSGLTVAKSKFGASVADTIATNAQLLSSTQAFQLRSYSASPRGYSHTYNYSSVWDVMVAREGFPVGDTTRQFVGTYNGQSCTGAAGCTVPVTVSGYVFAHSYTYSNKPLRCAYYYGNNHSINNVCYVAQGAQSNPK